MKLRAIAAAIAITGIIGDAALREAAATEFGQVRDLLQAALKRNYGLGENDWICMEAVYPDRVVILRDGKQFQFMYTIADDNTVALGNAQEVVLTPTPVTPAREAAPHTPESEAAPGGARGKPSPGAGNSAVSATGFFIEAADGGDKPTRYLVRVIRAGTSLNNVTYPASVLREAVPLFNGVRVFVKSDDEHLKGGGKDFRQLVGRLTEAKFVESKDGGEIQAVLDVLESSDVAAKLREAVSRGMTDLFGLSIDASGRSKQSGKFREATKLTKVASVDLIIEPGAGGQFIRFTEAKSHHEETDMLREQMMKAIAARDAKRAEGLADASDEQVLEAYREAVAAPAPAKTETTPAGVTAEQMAEQIRMVEARADARVAIAEAKLPKAIKDRLTTRFAEAASFKTEDVTAAIEAERKFLGELNDGAKVQGLGEFVEAGEDRADKVQKMLDEFFDPTKKAISFRECYVEMTGDRGVTGLMKNVDTQRLREAIGAANFREAISAATFGDALGDSITRAMLRDYNGANQWSDWQFLADVVPITDFRTQERARIGGYGNLPDVAEDGSYTALTSPGDEAASYAITKRGGTETISIETIANDDVGVIRRIPTKMAMAAARTLYEFVLDFIADNGNIYDTTALFVAGHNNLGSAALDATTWSAARLAMAKQAELTSAKRLGLVARHLIVPPDLEETAYNLFNRDTNNDPKFIQTTAPTLHAVPYWTDANNWYATADKSETPLIEIGFYNGNQEPEIFIQDSPNQGSLFSNDQIKYKIRHIYSGAVMDFRGFYGAVVA